MSLGVLNNLNAMYAENNLNNTSNSLNTVLQQLSSGSKINSGADDAAGLSLVNGLQANSMALAQSQTNAAEGVGLLKVADGALSQVTNLLNRAVTLATEASNGTLNASQDAAANSEYQSILSEINNIGATTTYNGQTVFGKDTSIYTGDSSTVGSSIDELHIGSLSSSNVGNSGGVMAYSSGQNSVFLNLSSSTQNANSTDTLNVNGTTTINVNYLVKGANNASTPASTAITVGGTSGYANTASGLVSAINKAGLGLSANFTTQSQAGVAGGGTQTGIQITGGLISVGSDPGSVSTGGTITLSGNSASSILAPDQTVTIQSGSADAIAINIDPTIKSLSDLAGAINAQSLSNVGNAAKTQVVATVVTNADNTQSLSLVDANPNGGKLSVTDTAHTYTPAVTVNAAVTGAAVGLTFTATQTGTAGTPAGATTPATQAVATLGISAITNNATDALSGTIVLSNGASGNITINMNNPAASDATTINLDAAHSNLNGLRDVLNGNSAAATALGVTAQVGAGGLTLTSVAGNTTIAKTSGNLTSTPIVSMQSSQAGAAAYGGAAGTAVITMAGGNGLNGTDTLTAGQNIKVTNGSLNSPGTEITFEVGGNTANNTLTHFYTGGANLTLGDLVGIMNSGAGAAAAGLSGAVLSGANGNITLTSSSVGTTITTTSTVIDPVSTNGVAYTAKQAQSAGTTAANTTFTSTGIVSDGNGDAITASGNDTYSGTMTLTNGGATVTVTMGSAGTNDATHIFLNAGSNTLAGLAHAINTPGVADAAVATLGGLTAAINANNTGMVFSAPSTQKGTQIVAVTTNLKTDSAMNFTNPTPGDASTYESGSLTLSDGAKINAGDPTLTGQMVITNGTTTTTFIMGNAGTTGTANGGNTNTVYVAGGKLSDLQAAITSEGGLTPGSGGNSLGLTAITDTATGGIFIQAGAMGANAFTVSGVTLSAQFGQTEVDGTAGNPVIPSNTPDQLIYGTGTHNLSTDVVSGHIVFKNSGGTNVNTTFTMGGSAYNSSNPAATGLGTNAVTVNGNTLADLARAIAADSTGLYAGVAGVDIDTSTLSVGTNGLTMKANSQSDTLSAYSSTLTDQYSLNNAVVGNASAPATGATYATATVGTGQSIGNGAELGGSIVLNNGGVNYTFTMAASSAGSTPTAINTNGLTLDNLRQAISQSGIGIQASIVNGALQLQSTNAATSITVVGTPTLTDTQSETFVGGSGNPAVSGSPSVPAAASQATVDLVGGAATALAADALSGSITLTGTGGTQTFQMGGTGSGAQTVGGITAVGSASSPFSENLGALAAAITADTALGITAQVTTHGLSLTMNSNINTPIGAVVNGLTDTSSAYSKATMTLGSFDSLNDSLSGGTFAFSVGGQAESVSVGPGTVSGLMTAINGASNTDPYGVHASWDSVNNKVLLTADAYGAAGNFTATSTNITDTTSGKSLAYAETGPYNVGISNSTSTLTALYDSSVAGSSAPTGPSAAYKNFTANAGSSSGTATISYSDGAGVSLSATDLSNQIDARAALASLNAAITAVAAQDGYIGAQINTLNSVSSVLATQQQNVVAAQNAVQATDYASAASNMSKYEILSQTGISALAQANSMQQEVTKLLQ